MCWISETYHRSFDKPEPLDLKLLKVLARTNAELNNIINPHDPLTPEQVYDNLIDPFIVNVTEDNLIYYLSAAKAAGVKIRVGEPKHGLPFHKGLYREEMVDLETFWKAYRQLREQRQNQEES